MVCSGVGKDRAGGVTMTWKDNLKISLVYFSLNHINVLVNDEEDDHPFFLHQILLPS